MGAHKGLGGKWKALDRNEKAKYVETSKKMRSAYENQMKGYRIKKQELLREIKAAKKTKRSPKIQKKTRVASKNKSKKIKVALKQLSKAVGKPKSVARMPAKKSQSEMMKVSRKINARIRMTCISS